LENKSETIGVITFLTKAFCWCWARSKCGCFILLATASRWCPLPHGEKGRKTDDLL